MDILQDLRDELLSGRDVKKTNLAETYCQKNNNYHDWCFESERVIFFRLLVSDADVSHIHCVDP